MPGPCGRSSWSPFVSPASSRPRCFRRVDNLYRKVLPRRPSGSIFPRCLSERRDEGLSFRYAAASTLVNQRSPGGK